MKLIPDCSSKGVYYELYDSNNKNGVSKSGEGMYRLISWPLRKRKKKAYVSIEADTETWEGKWKIVPLEPPQGHRMMLTISASGPVFLNHQPLEGETALVSASKWIFYDHFGYRLILNKADDGSFTLYDEADDKLYTAEKTV